jgi:hypothetical protein
MKRTLLFASMWSLSQFVLGQSTLTADQLKTYVPGNAFIEHSDTLSTFLPGAGGTNQTWDYSQLLSHTEDIISYIPAASTPNASKFATSTVAEHSQNNDSYDYYTVNGTGVFLDSYIGQLFADPTGLLPISNSSFGKFDPPLKELSFPVTYGSTWNSSYSQHQTIATPGSAYDSVRVGGSLALKNVVDAWGTLTTPLGPYPNALRIVSYMTTTEAVQVSTLGFWIPLFSNHTYDTTYTWWADGAIVLSLSATRTPTGTDSQANGPYHASYTGVLITDLSDTYIPGLTLALYPNPIDEQFNLSGVSNVISIRDVTGKGIGFKALKEAEGVWTVQLSDPPKGLYTAQVTTVQGIQKTLKFSVLR